jgi:hypothetical protein
MVQIENLSDDVAVAAIESGEYTVEKGFGFAGDALSTVTEASKDQLGSVLGFASDFLRQQTDATAQQRDAYDAQARRSTELIAAQAGVVAPANTDKQTLLLFGLAAGLGAIVLLKK